MKAIVIHDFVTHLDNIRVTDVPPPEPPQDGFLIRVHAAGVNFVDILYAQGKHQNNRSLVRPPFTLGLEFAGTVISAPPTSAFKPGDKIFGGHTGSYSEVISLPPSTTLHRIPPGWSMQGAAGMAATLPVAYGALVQRAGVKAGQTVLVHAAAGGLGIMAVQVAAALGCRVIGTAGSAEKCAVPVRYGAAACVDYTEHREWWKQVLGLTEGKGVDVVFDPVGLIDLSLKCVAHYGKLLVVGFAGGDIENVAMNRVLLKQVSLIGYRYGETLRRSPEEDRLLWHGLQGLVDSGRIAPVVYDTVYDGLESVPRALNDLNARKVWGKAVITVDNGAKTGLDMRL
ncbi:quinone oxidoreductase [Sodiomyces alkalinus F11]|uniref:Quinone oxidoreductase n=1 Tax=Sodiomyces alkalinus (strain CBS 110278 / VKM F-3762 / F11) TaxID=1314773 RepID=A0A3N2PP57_SODAK|nr:quinone oxidoreductase [Sodiomyces alkalinus F11]ROT36311.1 quinone oxidoreductase [Sodiomyces alkalinus F11]